MALVFQNWWWSGSDRLVNEIESESAAQTTRKTIEIEAGSALDTGVGVGVGVGSCLCPPGPRGPREKVGGGGRVGAPGIPGKKGQAGFPVGYNDKLGVCSSPKASLAKFTNKNVTLLFGKGRSARTVGYQWGKGTEMRFRNRKWIPVYF